MRFARLVLLSSVCWSSVAVAQGQPDSTRRDTTRQADSARVKLEAVTVTAAPDKRGNRIISRAELAKQEARRMVDVLTGMPGLRVMRANNGAAYAMSSRGMITIYGSNKRCMMQVYVDNVAVYRATGPNEPLYDLNQLLPRHIDRIELYAGGAQAPPQFNQTGSACGVLAFWTRDPVLARRAP
jgi:outer membrane receptor for ferrienterochelin and colicin